MVGTMAKIDDSVKKKVPELRFKGFTDEWEERKLGQYTKLITKGTTPKEKTGIGDVNFVKVENITSGKIYPINKIKQNEHDNYLKRSRLEEKDILFSIAGTLGRTAIVNKSILPANTNQALAIIRGYDFDTNFLITSLAGNVVKEYIRRNPTVGAQPNLSLEQVGNLLVNTPNAEEQQKIGSFFKQLDDTIALHQRKLDLLKEQKKGYLQKMFPKNGTKVPELRFAGFADDWEERKLSEGTSKIGDGLHGTPNYSDNGDVFFINGNNLVNGKIVITKETKLVTESNQSKDDKLLNTDTILMSINGTIGNLAWYNNERVMLGKSAAYLTVSNFDKKFIFSYLQTSTIKNYFLNNLTGTTIKNLGLKTIRDTTLFVPTLEEQQQIGEFFWTLEETIALHQRKLDLLKEQKKGFLQKMFV
ncbi:restriction endonuclease subunit S [Lactococcus lactis]|nr:restriction endonuclease subunit S [Lactococcus lactis]MCT1190746.1 restriction endonuclease subunit S [Lactococcus lactis]